jgi:hypothetical protein
LALAEFRQQRWLGTGIQRRVGQPCFQQLEFGLPAGNLLFQLFAFLLQLFVLPASPFSARDGGRLGGRRLVALDGLLGTTRLCQPVGIVVEVAVKGHDLAVGHQPELVAGGAQQVAVVRHQHHAGLGFLQGDGQRLAHLQVEMVGRLVEQQQVGRGTDHQRQGQPRLLAAGEAAAGGGGHVAAEVEAAEVVAQVLFAGARLQLDHVPQRRFGRAQLFELVLGEVAELEVAAFFAHTGQGLQFTGQQFHQRGFAGAVAAEQADAAVGAQGEAKLVEDYLPAKRRPRYAKPRLAVADSCIVDQQQRIGKAARLGEAEAEGRVDVGGLDLAHPGQHLDPALRLARLGGLGTEAVDVALQVRRLALLLGRQCQVVGQALGARSLAGRVVAGEKLQLAVLDGEDMGGDDVEKIAVVRDQDQRALIALEPVFEPEDGVEVQMVGRLVEQQEVGAAHQGAREVEAHAPAAGEFGHRSLEVKVGKTEAVHQGSSARRCGIAIDFSESRMQQPDLLAGMVVVVVVFRSGQIAFDLAQLDVAVEDEFQRGIGQGRRVLGDVGHDPARRALKVAAVGMQLATQQGQKGGFAAAVGAGETDLPAGMQLQRSAGDQGVAVAGKAEVAQQDHRSLIGEACSWR